MIPYGRDSAERNTSYFCFESERLLQPKITQSPIATTSACATKWPTCGQAIKLRKHAHVMKTLYSPTDFQLFPIRGLPCRRDNILMLFFVNNRSQLFACLSYSSQSWYRDAPLYAFSVCQISRRSDMAFAFYSSFCKCAKRGRKIRRKKTKKRSQFLKSHISGTLEVMSLKFGMWNA